MILQYDDQSSLAPDQALSAKDIALIRLSAGLSHELNNIFMVIQGNLSLIRESGLPSHTLDALVDEMQTVSRRGINLSHKLQAYAGRAPLRSVTFDLKEVVEQTIPELKKTTLRDVTVQLSLPERPCTVHIDRDMAVAALGSLAANARAAMRTGGLFSVELRQASSAFAGHQRKSDHVCFALLRVSDDGIGMTQHALESATDPMFSLKDGTLGRFGWGLSIVAGFVRQSHGRMMLSRRPHSGTQVDIYLPLAGGETSYA